MFFSGERRHALVDKESEEPRDEDWAKEFSGEPFEADAFLSVTGITVAPDKAHAHSANPDTAVCTGKTSAWPAFRR